MDQLGPSHPSTQVPLRGDSSAKLHDSLPLPIGELLRAGETLFQTRERRRVSGASVWVGSAEVQRSCAHFELGTVFAFIRRFSLLDQAER